MWQQQQMQLTSQMIQQHEQMSQQHDHHTRFAQLACLHSLLIFFTPFSNQRVASNESNCRLLVILVNRLQSQNQHHTAGQNDSQQQQQQCWNGRKRFPVASDHHHHHQQYNVSNKAFFYIIFASTRLAHTHMRNTRTLAHHPRAPVSFSLTVRGH